MKFKSKALLASVSAVALMAAAPAFADAHKEETGAKSGAQMTDTNMQAQTQIKADELVGQSLRTPNGEAVGDIESVILDKDGKVAALIVGVGGFLGMGEREVAIGWKQVNLMDGGKTIQTNLTKAQLEGMPQYKYKDEANRGKAFSDPNYIDPGLPSGRSSQPPAGTNQ